jgi:hypothetical protein
MTNQLTAVGNHGKLFAVFLCEEPGSFGNLMSEPWIAGIDHC